MRHSLSSHRARTAAAITAALVALGGCNDVLGIAPLTVAPSASDGGDEGGGAVDGGDTEAGDRGWCASNAPQATACMDFDGASGFAGAGWQPLVGTASETGALDEVTFRSAPRGLTMTTPAISGGAHGQWCILHPFPGSRRVSVAFDVRVDTLDPNGAYVTLADVALAGAPPSSGTHVAFSFDRVGAHVNVLDGPNVTKDDTLAAAPALATKTWTRVELDVQRALDGGSGATVSVLFDGRPVALASGAPATTFDVAGTGDTAVVVGAGYVSGGSIAQVIHVDDVVVDLR